MSTSLRAVCVRPADAGDIPRIAEIYADHVMHGLASFETEPPDEAEMRLRFLSIRDLALPYLVAEAGGVIAGYAYAAVYRARPAYRYTVEDSVYVDKDYVGRGIGSALMPALIDGCTAAGRRQMIAVIGDSKNAGSIRLHEKFGFRHAGLLPAV